MMVDRVWFEVNRIYAYAEDGRVLWQSLLWYRRLSEADDAQRTDYEMDDEAAIGGMRKENNRCVSLYRQGIVFFD